jgi:hypothetical protein
MLTSIAESGEFKAYNSRIMTTNDADMQRESGRRIIGPFLEGLMRLVITRPGMTGGNSTRLKSASVVALGCAVSITVLIAPKLALF